MHSRPGRCPIARQAHRRGAARGRSTHGEIDTVARRDHRHAGPAAGQAAPRALLPRRGPRARHRGLQLPARRRRRHEHRRRLRDVVAGTRLRRLRDAARPRTLRRCPGSPAPRMVLADLAWHDGAAGRRRRPGRSCAASSTGWPSTGWPPTSGTELEFIVFRDTYEQAWSARLPRPHPGQPVQRRLLAARHRPDRAAAAPHPQRDGRRRACTSSRPRASATSASTRSPSGTTRRSAPATTTSIYKNGAKEIAAQEGMALTFMAKFDEREGNSCHIHLSLPRHRRRARSMAGDGPTACPPSASTFVAGQLAHMRELTLLLAPEHQLLQAVPAGLVRADRAALGPRQPHLRAAAGRPRRRRCGWRTGCPAATSTRTWPSPRMIAGGLHGIEQRLELEPAFDGQRLRRPGRRARADHACASALDLWRGSDVRPRGVRRRRRRPLRQHGRGRAGGFDAAVTDWERFRGFERL